MFGLEILDVVIGLMFVYLLLSLLATALNEYVSAVMNLRGKELAKGLGQLLDDVDEKGAVERALAGLTPNAVKPTTINDTLTERLYNHRLIRPLATRRGLFFSFRKSPRLPSYIPARTFALALLDLLGVRDDAATVPGAGGGGAGGGGVGGGAGEGAAAGGAGGAVAGAGVGGGAAGAGAAAGAGQPPIPPELARVLAILKRESPYDVNQVLTGLLGNAALPASAKVRLTSALAASQTQLQNLHDSVEVWFNNSMDRVTGAYKRNVQGILFLLGLLIASCSNADTIDMWHRLASNDELRSAMAKRAAAYVAASDTTTSDTAASDTTASDTTASDTTQNNSLAADTTAAVDTTANPPEGTDTTTNPPPAPDTTSTDTSAVAKARQKYLDARADLDSMELKLGWTNAERMRIGLMKPDSTYKGPKPAFFLWNGGFWFKLLGLLMTAIAISLGAPFWFDMLNKVISIRSAGRSPSEKPKSPEGRSTRPAEHEPR